MVQKPNNVYEEKGPITDALLGRMDAWFRAANYLSAGQLYLLENPLLKKPLTLDRTLFLSISTVSSSATIWI